MELFIISKHLFIISKHLIFLFLYVNILMAMLSHFPRDFTYHNVVIVELSKLNGSRIVEGLIVTRKVKKNFVSNWKWYIKCGVCTKDFLLRVDADCQGRVNFFMRRMIISFYFVLIIFANN